jgi:TLR4 regulator and MIR-interacting MSAP
MIRPPFTPLRALGAIAILLLSISLVHQPAAADRRLPRGYTPGAFCSACRAVSAEFYAAWAAVSPEETVTSGSFRLSGSGKQRGLTRVPLRQSATHATHVLETVCAQVKDKFVVFPEIAPDVFVAVRDAEAAGVKVNATKDTRAVRALGNVCSSLVDEYYDMLVAVVQAAPLERAAWVGDGRAFCGGDGGEGGVVAACGRGAGQVRVAAEVLEEAKALKVEGDAYRAAVEAEAAAGRNATADGGEERSAEGVDGLSRAEAAVDGSVVDGSVGGDVALAAEGGAGKEEL